MKPVLLLATALCAALLPRIAVAQSSLSEIVELDVLEGGMTAEKTYQTALRLKMAEGWKTYWRSPGDAGIPPRILLRGARNVAGIRITWPTPEVFDQSGMKSIGYTSELVLPVEVTPKSGSRGVKFRGRIDFGICHDVCIPASLDFSQDLDPEAGRNPSIVAALASRPYSQQEAGVGAVDCRISPTEDGLKVTARIAVPSAGGQEFAVFEADDPEIWSSEAEVTRKGGTLTATSELIHVNGDPYLLDRSALRITVIGSKHAVDIHGCSTN